MKPGCARLAVLLALAAPRAAPQTAPAPQPQPTAAATPAAPEMTLPLMLRKLRTTARILHITAHPDDEDAGMLALESWGKGATVMLLTLNRGEGGQNITGDELFDRLGILRTLELLQADRYYGVEQRFTRAADFGFSKSAEEAFQKWGHDAVLADVVRVVREFQPDVIVSRFQGAPRDGHGHHQAAGILAREAFRAAADANRFPEQIKEGLLPWQAKKLYVDNIRAGEDYTVKLETSAADPLLGESYFQVARAGARHHLSQGAGNWQIPGGAHYSYYKLMDTTIPNYHPEHEQDFMDGIATGLTAALPADASSSSVGALQKAEAKIAAAEAAAGSSATAALPALSDALRELRAFTGSAPHSDAERPDAERHARLLAQDKEQQVEQATNLAAGVELEARVAPQAADASAPQPLVRGERFQLQIELMNHGAQPVTMEGISLALCGHMLEQRKPSHQVIAPGGTFTETLSASVPGDAPVTQPYFHRDHPQVDALYQIDQPKFVTLPFAPPALRVTANYTAGGRRHSIAAVAQTWFTSNGAVHDMGAAIAPDFSVRVSPPTEIIPMPAGRPRPLKVSITSNLPEAVSGRVKLELPAGWQAQPESVPVRFTAAGQQQEVDFQLFPASAAGRFQVKARVMADGKDYSQGYELIGRPDIGYAYYYEPARQEISVVDVKTVPGLKVGYIMGAGDDIPTALSQAGINVRLISPEELATGDLTGYDTIIVGIRAYDTRADVRRYNSRLLNFVSQGGTLMVQYNSGVADFNSGSFAPYPATLSRERVTVEEAPVTLLAPQDPIFHFPNQITAQDFSGWVQERGLNFITSWDPHLQALLSCHDPGEPPLDGGLLVARYGKGIYIYNGYSFFRQLPSGVAGAVRLYVNLLSAGRQQPAP